MPAHINDVRFNFLP